MNKAQYSIKSFAQAYAFTYDGISRLTAADYGRGATMSDVDNYDVSGISYDLNGNILGLKRNEKDLESNAIHDIDRLTYDYEGNQLKSVADASLYDSSVTNKDKRGFIDGATATTEYLYDDNMTKDLNKGITDIQYNYLNLPEQISINSKKIRYVYSASGEKLQNIVDGKTIAYCGAFVYEDGALQYILNSGGALPC